MCNHLLGIIPDLVHLEGGSSLQPMDITGTISRKLPVEFSRGAFGNVYYMRVEETKSLVVMKSGIDQEELLREAKLLLTLHPHPNIMR